MILLTAITDKIQVVTDVTVTMDAHASFVDHSSGTITPGKQNTAITTPATYDVVNAPGSSTQRNLRTLNVRNRDSSANVDVIIQFNQNGTIFTLFRASISKGEVVHYSEETGFVVLERFIPLKTPFSTADQTANAADTYLTGSGIAIPNNRKIAVGTTFKWKLAATKTNVSTSAGVFNIRFGTAGTISDTARLVFTMTAQTAATDTGYFDILATVRGPIGATCIVQGQLNAHHHNATTGFMNLNHNVVNAISAAFDITINDLIVGLSANPGTGVWTFQLCFGEVINI